MSLPMFNQLLNEVHSCLEASDAFDVDGDPMKEPEFARLNEAYVNAAIELVAFCRTDGAGLLEALARLRDMTAADEQE